MKWSAVALALLGAMTAWAGSGRAQTALTDVERLVGATRDASYPQLKGLNISVRQMNGESDFLRARFTFSSYFFGRRLRYLVLYNSKASHLGVPPEGLQAIIAHELAHVSYFHARNRIRMLGLVCLLSPSFTARFERRTDLEAIALGYGRGLQQYRLWLYRHIPAGRVLAKKRNYFSPEEIEAILHAKEQNVEIMRRFERCVPRSLREIEQAARNPAGY